MSVLETNAFLLFNEKKSIFKVLLKDIYRPKKSLDHQSKLLAIVMVYVEICVKGNASNIYCIETTTINMQNFAVFEIFLTRIVIVKQKLN